MCRYVIIDKEIIVSTKNNWIDENLFQQFFDEWNSVVFIIVVFIYKLNLQEKNKQF